MDKKAKGGFIIAYGSSNIKLSTILSKVYDAIWGLGIAVTTIAEYVSPFVGVTEVIFLFERRTSR